MNFLQLLHTALCRHYNELLFFKTVPRCCTVKLTGQTREKGPIKKYQTKPLLVTVNWKLVKTILRCAGLRVRRSTNWPDLAAIHSTNLLFLRTRFPWCLWHLRSVTVLPLHGCELETVEGRQDEKTQVFETHVFVFCVFETYVLSVFRPAFLSQPRVRNYELVSSTCCYSIVGFLVP